VSRLKTESPTASKKRRQATALVKEVLRIWEARDVEAMLGLMTEDIYWHDLGMWSPPAVGREAVRGFVTSLLRAFPDFTFELRGPICVADNGESAVIPWTITATNKGPLCPPGMAPTGRKVRFQGMDYLQFRDGKVARIETRFDPVEPLEQMLGVRARPPAGSLRERCLVALQRAFAAWARRKR